MISLIAAVDECLGLGKDNQLLCHLPADLKYFKEKTLGKPIIMGRKTYESIGRALPGRLNVVISQHLPFLDDAKVVPSLQDALNLTIDYPEVMIIGGAQVFKQAFPLADQLYLTKIHAQFNADVFFPALDIDMWECSESTHRPKDDKNGYDLTFYRYDRKKCLTSS